MSVLNIEEKNRRIEETRNRLDALVIAKGFNMKDPEIIALSAELDCLIVDFEKAKKL